MTKKEILAAGLVILTLPLLLTPTAYADAWPQLDKLLAADGAELDWFGYSVSLSGDYALVGTTYGDGNESDSGSAYIFQRDGTTWSQQAKLTAADGTAEDYFGWSVSLNGNYALVGAYGDDDNGDQSGSAYIFQSDGANWTQQAKLLAAGGADNDYFGHSVSLNSDYALVGTALGKSAYIFKRNGTTWSQQAKLLADDGAAVGYGYSVSLSGDYALIGAWGDDNNGSYSGSAYIFKRSDVPDDPSWSQQAKLTAADGASDDFFGLRVSLSGDYALVGALFDDDHGDDSGSAYIFHRDGATWSQQAKLIAADGAAEDFFGQSLSLSGDYALVGTWGDDDNGDFSGSAYIFGGCPTADLTGDCFVDLRDLAILAQQWLDGH